MWCWLDDRNTWWTRVASHHHFQSSPLASTSSTRSKMSAANSVPPKFNAVAGYGLMSDKIKPSVLVSDLEGWEARVTDVEMFRTAVLERLTRAWTFIREQHEELPLTSSVARRLWNLFLEEIVSDPSFLASPTVKVTMDRILPPVACLSMPACVPLSCESNLSMRVTVDIVMSLSSTCSHPIRLLSSLTMSIRHLNSWGRLNGGARTVGCLIQQSVLC